MMKDVFGRHIWRACPLTALGVAEKRGMEDFKTISIQLTRTEFLERDALLWSRKRDTQGRSSRCMPNASAARCIASFPQHTSKPYVKLCRPMVLKVLLSWWLYTWHTRPHPRRLRGEP
ncbi:hypothetical protein VUR80DRAFT_5761 [Thermomyces stellatus]